MLIYPVSDGHLLDDVEVNNVVESLLHLKGTDQPRIKCQMPNAGFNFPASRVGDTTISLLPAPQGPLRFRLPNLILEPRIPCASRRSPVSLQQDLWVHQYGCCNHSGTHAFALRLTAQSHATSSPPNETRVHTLWTLLWRSQLSRQS